MKTSFVQTDWLQILLSDLKIQFLTWVNINDCFDTDDLWFCLDKKAFQVKETLTCVSCNGHFSEQTLDSGRPPLSFKPAFRQVRLHLPAPGHPLPPFPLRIPIQHKQRRCRRARTAAPHQLRQRQQETGFLPGPRRESLNVNVGMGEGQGIVGRRTQSWWGGGGKPSWASRALRAAAAAAAVTARFPAGKLSVKEGFFWRRWGGIWGAHPRFWIGRRLPVWRSKQYELLEPEAQRAVSSSRCARKIKMCQKRTSSLKSL